MNAKEWLETRKDKEDDCLHIEDALIALELAKLEGVIAALSVVEFEQKLIVLAHYEIALSELKQKHNIQ